MDPWLEERFSIALVPPGITAPEPGRRILPKDVSSKGVVTFTQLEPGQHDLLVTIDGSRKPVFVLSDIKIGPGSNRHPQFDSLDLRGLIAEVPFIWRHQDRAPAATVTAMRDGEVLATGTTEKSLLVPADRPADYYLVAADGLPAVIYPAGETHYEVQFEENVEAVVEWNGPVAAVTSPFSVRVRLVPELGRVLESGLGNSKGNSGAPNSPPGETTVVELHDAEPTTVYVSNTGDYQVFVDFVARRFGYETRVPTVSAGSGFGGHRQVGDPRACHRG